MKFSTSAALLLIAASSVFAQVDAFSLRSKYGAPLERETFQVRPNIEMVVDYGPNKKVCRIQLPSGSQFGGTVPPAAITKQQINEVVDEVVPPSIRGKEINRAKMYAGRMGFTVTEYENLGIGEGDDNGVGIGITITFKDPTCPKKAVPFNTR